jgi:hypothetical protein
MIKTTSRIESLFRKNRQNIDRVSPEQWDRALTAARAHIKMGPIKFKKNAAPPPDTESQSDEDWVLEEGDTKEVPIAILDGNDPMDVDGAEDVGSSNKSSTAKDGAKVRTENDANSIYADDTEEEEDDEILA